MIAAACSDATPQPEVPQQNLRRSARRKALFPTDGDSDDLGLISSIHSGDSNSSSNLENEIFSFLKKTNSNDYVEDGRNLVTPSPLLYSPQQSLSLLTPLGKSPTSKLKTPHDTSTVKVNSKQPKRKLQDVVVQELNKSKVRTALFPENGENLDAITIPVKSFYPKNVGSPEKKVCRVLVENKRFRGSRVPNRRKEYGGINNGVKHKIKKPKKKKAARERIIKAAKNIMETSALNEYLEEMALVRNTISKKQIKKIDEISQGFEKKENVCKAKIAKDDPSRRFFKSERQPATVSITEGIKLVLGDGQTSLETKKRKFGEEFSTNIDNIIKSLDSEIIANHENLILSPTSQMCDMASGLAIRSPKRAKLNINSLLDLSADGMERKLFPIFTDPVSARKASPRKAGGGRKWSKQEDSQMLLDAGQKRFGLLECAECGMMYHQGDPNDEIGHLKYHNSVDTLKFAGWKNERVVGEFPTGRIIKIQAGDSKAWWKKVKDLMDVVNKDLGFYEGELSLQNSQIYLYIKNKQIIGCVVGEVRSSAYRMLPPINGLEVCSEEAYPIKAGVSRVWVSHLHRKGGVATALLDALRANFLPGFILAPTDVALSSPTDSGKLFAAKYFKTPNFLIYM